MTNSNEPSDAAQDQASQDQAAQDQAGQDQAGQDQAAEASIAGRDSVTLDGPAAENEEMRLGTEDLQSSEVKSAAAKEIFNDLQGSTLPESKES